jgi:phospholipid/cholesterol/gamma-HCH transport system permease protein
MEARAVKSRPGWVEAIERSDSWVLRLGGAWNLQVVNQYGAELERLQPAKAGPVSVDLTELETLDTVAAIVLRQVYRRLLAAGNVVSIVGLKEAHRSLFQQVDDASKMTIGDTGDRRPPGIIMLARIGESALGFAREARALLGFAGEVAVATLRTARQPQRLRLVPILANIEMTGLNAMPIVGLLSFLIGVVMAYQGAEQLRQFGAEIFVVNLLGVSVLRELGVLMTAIIIAGRSGSAFAAQIGTMKVNQEIDALRTIGLDPVEVLVLPRIIALVIALPFLAFFANLAALFGGAIMSAVSLGINLQAFLVQLQQAVTLSTLWIGLIKAPVFGLVIAMVGCYQGLNVAGSAESVGIKTTAAVVHSIFLVIALDAGFSILFSLLGV